MPTIAEQLRTARRRRRHHRRRFVAGLAVGVPGLLLGVRIVGAEAGISAGAASVTTGSTVAASSTTTTPTALHPGLVAAFERAQAEAADDGHALSITSGFRTAAEQAALLEAEVAERGSLEEARWWVFPPDRSMHVQGLAIDVGDGPAADWLVEEGDRFGLCRTLDWEWWHFEWRQRWEDTGSCPEPATVPEEAPGP